MNSIEMISTSRIFPPHGVQDAGKFEAIRDDMKTNRWTGRPLLVVEYGDAYLGLTGSHRWAGANAADMEEIPCVQVNLELLAEAGYDADDLRNASDELEIAAILNEAGDADAANLLYQEYGD